MKSWILPNVIESGVQKGLESCPTAQLALCDQLNPIFYIATREAEKKWIGKFWQAERRNSRDYRTPFACD